MNVTPTCLPGVTIIKPRRHLDGRGFFTETWNRDSYEAAGIPPMVAQDNLSCSRHGVLRGLHFQYPKSQAKLVYVLHGKIFDVAVDVRFGSPTFGQSFATELSCTNGKQLFIPHGFAHGFCVLSDTALVVYKCSHPYDRANERGIAWNDPSLCIEWPIEHPILSVKDRELGFLRESESKLLPRWSTSLYETSPESCGTQIVERYSEIRVDGQSLPDSR